MSFISRFFSGGGGANQRRAGLQTGEAGSYPAKSPVTVNQDSALCLSAFWACVRLLSESIASMPLHFYRNNDDGTRTRIFDHELAQLFAGKVNRYQNRFEFFETMTMLLAMHGNAYALRQTNPAGQLIGLLPLMSPQMEVTLNESGAVVYRYNDGVKIQDFAESKIWHVKLMGNGIIGLSPLSFARNSIGIGLAAENATGRILHSDGKPAGTLSLPHEAGTLTEEQRQRLKSNFRGLAESSNDNLFLLEMGLQYQQISMSPQDIELLSSRSFQLKDVARFMGVPSVLINDMDATTVWGSGIGQIVQGFYKFGLRPYLERYEASMVTHLLLPQERGQVDVEFDFNALVRAETGERIKTYGEAIRGGFMTPNEARKQEGMVGLEGGDKLYMQAQMTPMESLRGLGLDDNA